jgi:hypothetical protein
MLQCPRCDATNPDANIYCDRCGSPLTASSYTPPYTSEQSAYISQQDYSAPPQSEYGGGMAPQMLLYQNISPTQPNITVFWIVRAILYFIAIFIAAFGLFAAFTAFSNAHVIIGLGIFFMIGFIVAGVVFFIRVKHRVQHLHLWPLVGWICGATVGAFMAVILDDAFFYNFSKNPVGTFIFWCIVLLYGLILAGVALW